GLDEEFSSYSENYVSRIVAFHEFCRPLIDRFLSQNAKLVKKLSDSLCNWTFGLLRRDASIQGGYVQ
ncbi:hypothetical protein, partial [Mesotoga sp.]|uniref:hypothetical protein n=1 Tax=Mesotoga sp. TaxID=2053577 RepID=UPI00345E1876